MTDQFVPFGSERYFIVLALALFSRGMDLLSTWITSPRLVGEGNPIAKWMGWRGGIISSVIFSAVVAVWPLPAIVVSVMSLLVAARNFQAAWMVRSMGEAAYAMFIHERMAATQPGLFVFCMAAQSGIFALVGGALVWTTPAASIAATVGWGIVGFAFANITFTMLSLWRNRRG